MSQKKKTTDAKLDKVEREKLRLKDFLGNLAEAEIPIAKKHGLLAFDLYQKAKRQASRETQLRVSRNYKAGLRLAPVFGKDGKPQGSTHQRITGYIVRNYEDLEKLQRDEGADGSGR